MKDTLVSLMAELRERINSQDVHTPIKREEIEDIKSDLVVVMPAGGKGTRIRAETHSENINKVMIRINERESMIERTVRIYSEFGIDKFVVLTGFLSDVVEDHLGDGSRWGVEILYSEDPEGRKVGNAGAIRNALDKGTLDPSYVSIIHNPDDIIIKTQRPYPEIFLEGYLRAKKRGCICSLVVVPETPYSYSGMVVEKGLVKNIMKYPSIPIPTHTGISVFDPEIYEYFRSMVDLRVESSFEDIICPTLAEENLLFAVEVPSKDWIPVNDLKGLERARVALIREMQ